MNVIKRDGKIEPFNIAKIIKAMESAFVEVDGKLTEVSLGKIHSIALDIEKIDKSKDLQVEEIQDIIEKKLMATNRKDVAKAYILYRAERNRIRDRNSAFRKELNENYLLQVYKIKMLMLTKNLLVEELEKPVMLY